MDLTNLTMNIDVLGACGVILTLEQKAALQNSLIIVRDRSKYTQVIFWGKIIGVKSDYFIAQGRIGDNNMKGANTLYSLDCINWALLPAATDSMKANAKQLIGRFCGDPSYELDFEESVKKEDGSEEHKTVTVKEEDRLAAVISEIDQDNSLVPRCAFIKTPTGDIVSNRSWEGLSILESGKLGNFMHLRPSLKEKSLLQRSYLDKAIDFLDTIEEDEPNGIWSIQCEQASNIMVIKNLQWIGYNFYYRPETKMFGSVYYGTGEKNKDILFMLDP